MITGHIRKKSARWPLSCAFCKLVSALGCDTWELGSRHSGCIYGLWVRVTGPSVPIRTSSFGQDVYQHAMSRASACLHLHMLWMLTCCNGIAPALARSWEAHRLEGDEGNAFEAACVWEAHEIHLLNLSTVGPVFSYVIFLQKHVLSDQTTAWSPDGIWLQMQLLY